MSYTIVLEGHATPDQTLTYLHLPFEVPIGIGRLEVQYNYNAMIGSNPDLVGGNTIDIGIFDTRGIAFLDAGFRGWSGSARTDFFVAEDAATPGYMPGPIQAGQWHICLGLYKVAPDGCHYRVEIVLSEKLGQHLVSFPPRLTLQRDQVARTRSDGWYRGEIHCHTVNSDGDTTVEALIHQAEALDLDFLAITDHNNLTHQVDMAQIETPLVLIPGVEVTTYYGHWNIWGDGAWVDFRVQNAADLQRAMTFAQAQGYLVSCNHPRPYGPEWTFSEVDTFDCVEVWNGPWEMLNNHCLAFLERHLKTGAKLTALGGSDFHFSLQPHIAKLAHPTVYVYAAQAPGAREILEGLRSGQVFISESPTGPRIWIESDGIPMGGTVAHPNRDSLLLDITVQQGQGLMLDICGADGILLSSLVTTDEAHLRLPIQAEDSPYIRAQLLDLNTSRVRALTNPIYLA